MHTVMSGLETLRRFGQRLGPYLVLEILLPGGTLLALLLFLYQRRKLDTGSVVSWTVAMTRAFASMVGQGIFVPRPCYLRPWQSFQPGRRDGFHPGDLQACRTRVSQCRIWAPPYDYGEIRHPRRSTTIRSEP